MKIDEINTKKELIEISKKTFTGQMDLMEGCILINNIIDTSKEEHDFLLPIKGIISEIDDILEEKHINSKEEIPQKVKDELDHYIINEKQLILDICQEIVQKYYKDIKKFEESINETLIKNDPIKIYFEDLEGKYKYDSELKFILGELNNINSAEQAGDTVRFLFIDMYGDVPKEGRKIFDNIGKEIWALMN